MNRYEYLKQLMSGPEAAALPEKEWQQLGNEYLTLALAKHNEPGAAMRRWFNITGEKKVDTTNLEKYFKIPKSSDSGNGNG